MQEITDTEMEELDQLREHAMSSNYTLDALNRITLLEQIARADEELAAMPSDPEIAEHRAELARLTLRLSEDFVRVGK